MFLTCPTCKSRGSVAVLYLKCGHEGRLGPHRTVRPSQSTVRRAWWARLRAKTEALAAAGVPIEPDELTAHKKRAPLTRMHHLYNLERSKSGLPALSFLEFDPWGAHLGAQELAWDVLTDFKGWSGSMERLFPALWAKSGVVA